MLLRIEDVGFCSSRQSSSPRYHRLHRPRYLPPKHPTHPTPIHPKHPVSSVPTSSAITLDTWLICSGGNCVDRLLFQNPRRRPSIPDIGHRLRLSCVGPFPCSYCEEDTGFVWRDTYRGDCLDGVLCSWYCPGPWYGVAWSFVYLILAADGIVWMCSG